MSRGTRAYISQKALHHNYEMVKKYAPNSKVWAIVKANAYGHGAINVAHTLDEADGFGVSTLNEAIALRDSGITSAILLLEGVTEAEHLSSASSHNFECVLHSIEQVEQIKCQDFIHPLRVWIKVDTGMHRLGIEPELLSDIRQELAAITGIELAGIMTHLACADDDENYQTTQRQIERFENCVTPDDTLSIANSAAILSWKDTHRGWVRPGIMLYGASPMANKSAMEFQLKPVMTLMSPVIAIRSVLKGEAIGYGHRWRADRDSKIATLAIGYGDGYPRHAPNGTPVWLHNNRVPLVGRVSMDMIMVDVTDLDSVSIGDQVELWGGSLSVDEVAQFVGTIGYELLTRISPRVTHELVD